MESRSVACYVYDQKGNPVTAASFELHEAERGAEAVLSRMDQPGRLVQRCIVGGVRELWLHLRDGRLLPVSLESTYFQPDIGRVCVMRPR
jgi:hypothetical protein